MGVVVGVVFNAITTALLFLGRSVSDTLMSLGTSLPEFLLWGSVFAGVYWGVIGTAIGALAFLIRFRVFSAPSARVRQRRLD